MKNCSIVRLFGLLDCLIVGALTLTVVAAESPTVAKYRTLKEELLTCPENVFEAKRAEMLKFLADPGETNPVRLVEFYLDVVNRDQQGIFEKPDCWALAEKASKLSAAARSKYCQNRLWMLGQTMRGRWGGTLDPKWSYEGRLKFAEEVMNDPLLNDAYLKAQARNYKFEALRLLGRDRELLAYFDAELAKAKTDVERAEVLNARAAYYLESAKRYQDKSEPSVLKKALADLTATTVTNGVYRDKRDYGRKLVLKADVELQLGQLAEANATLDRYFDEFPDNGAMRKDVEVKLGEVAYAAKDYATAVRYWAPYVKGWKENVPATERYVRALFALGRFNIDPQGCPGIVFAGPYAGERPKKAQYVCRARNAFEEYLKTKFGKGEGSRDGDDGIRGEVVAAVEASDAVGRGTRYLLRVEADGGPAVGVPAVGEGTQQMLRVAVRLVEVSLLELLDDHLLLHLHAVVGQRDATHTVGFQAEGRLDVALGHGDVERREVAVRESVVFAANQLHLRIVVGDAGRTFVHQMLKQMSPAGVGRILIARPYLI